MKQYIRLYSPSSSPHPLIVFPSRARLRSTHCGHIRERCQINTRTRCVHARIRSCHDTRHCKLTLALRSSLALIVGIVQGVQSNVAPQPVGFEAGFKGNLVLNISSMLIFLRTTRRRSATHRKSPPSERRSIGSMRGLHRELHRRARSRHVLRPGLRPSVRSSELH